MPACAGSQLYHGQLGVLDKGMRPGEAGARLLLEPRSIHRATVDGRTIEFHRYRLNNDLTGDQHLLAYENGRLVYWGYVDEFRRQPDVQLSQAVSRVLPEVMALK